jgi:hypothetical protein
VAVSRASGKQDRMAAEDGKINALLVRGKERVKETRFTYSPVSIYYH